MATKMPSEDPSSPFHVLLRANLWLSDELQKIRKQLYQAEVSVSAAENRNDNVIPMAPITRKGTDSDGTGGPPWLLLLPVGTVFLCKLAGAHLMCYKIYKITEAGSVLMASPEKKEDSYRFGGEFGVPEWWDGVEFSLNRKFIEVLGCD